VTILVFRFDYSSESYSLGENFSRSGKYVPAEYEKVI
jgi:hypothetical protein